MNECLTRCVGHYSGHLEYTSSPITKVSAFVELHSKEGGQESIGEKQPTKYIVYYVRSGQD